MRPEIRRMIISADLKEVATKSDIKELRDYVDARFSSSSKG